MLSQRCGSFRDAFLEGWEISHLASCEVCRAWSENVARLSDFGADLELPDSLRSRLRRIADSPAAPRGTQPVAAVVLAPLPRVAMPESLRARLHDIPHAPRTSRRLPIWVVNARYGVAASLVVATLAVSALGDTVVADGQQAANAVSQKLTESLSSVGVKGGMGIERIEDTAVLGYRHGRKTVEVSVAALTAAISSLSNQIRELWPDDNDADKDRRTNAEETNHGT